MSKSSSSKEVAHYVATAHPPGGVLKAIKCNFLAPDSEDVVIAKSRKLEVRQLLQTNSEETSSQQTEENNNSSSPFPVVWSVPINGRITSLQAFSVSAHPTSFLFLTTDEQQYAVVSYNEAATPYPIETHASGSLEGEEMFVLGKLAECGPLVSVDPHHRCIVTHLYDGLLTIFPIQQNYQGTASQRQQQRTKGFGSSSSFSGRSSSSNSSILGAPFHARLEERTLLSLCILNHSDPEATLPHVCLLHQDSRGAQHITTHAVDLQKAQLYNLSSNNTINSSGLSPNSSERLKKSRVDGGSSLILPVPPLQPSVAAAPSAQPTAPVHRNSGGVVILGQRQITYCAMNGYKVMPIPPALLLSWDVLPPDASGMPRFLLGDEFGNLHMLTLITQDHSVIALQLDTLGSCTLASQLLYLDAGIVFCGSILGDSQLIQVHDEPIPVDLSNDDHALEDALELDDTTYLSVMEEYTNLGPIVDFDLVPTTPGGSNTAGSNATENGLGQSQVVTASGTSKSGSLRVIRNGIGMNEYASIELGGIQNMWSLRQDFDDTHHTYLVQSYVGQTRVLGVSSSSGDEDVAMKGTEDEEEEDVGGTLEEVLLPGLESNESTLFVGNVVGNLMVQITEQQLRLSNQAGKLLDTWTHPNGLNITVGVGNEAGQVAVALRGGLVISFDIQDGKFSKADEKQMDKEVSCLNLNPFTPTSSGSMRVVSTAQKSSILAVGQWDDFTVRLLSLDNKLSELVQIHLSTQEEEEEMKDSSGANEQRRNRNNMMARSLCLVTLDFSASHSSEAHNSKSSLSSSSSPGVNMLFVGLGDGTLVSFAVVQQDGGRTVAVQSKKEVSLGTQRINLVPLKTERGGTCVLATGDRPTVIYLAGVGGTSASNFNPKLCYSNVNLSAEEEEDSDGSNDVSRPHAQESIAVNVAAPFFSPLLFDAMGSDHYSLCVADDANLRLGVIDDIQKLHVTTCRLGMAPRRIVHYAEGHMFAVGCIESGIQDGLGGGEMSMGNCIRFLDDTTFDDIERIDLEPCEMVLSIACVNLKMNDPSQSSSDEASMTAQLAGSEPERKSYIIIGTAYALHDEDEPSKGRIMVMSSSPDGMSDTGTSSRTIRMVSELQVRGGVYSLCQFYQGKFLATINSKTQLCQLTNEGAEGPKLSMLGVGHHGHILSLFVKSRASELVSDQKSANKKDGAEGEEKEDDKKPKAGEEMLAIVGDLMRSISLVQYYPEHETLEEIARDFNANWTTAVEMLSNDIFIGAENWNNLYVLRRNTKAQSDEIKCRLDTVGEFHLGEMCNKFMSGSLVMPLSSSPSSNTGAERTNRRRSLASPTKKSADGGKTGASSSSNAAGRNLRPMVVVGSQTLFGTVDGTLGSILGLDGPTAAFFTALERAMERVIKPVGNFSHKKYRAFSAEKRVHPSHGFVDGDLVESFLDLDSTSMQSVVQEMNKDGGWQLDDPAFAAAESSNSSDRDSAMAVEDDGRPELSVEDVVAVVEEMTMLH